VPMLKDAFQRVYSPDVPGGQQPAAEGT
jgi:hypothetical protein